LTSDKVKKNGHQGGFTMVEIIAVLILVSILAFVAIPRLVSSGDNTAQVFSDQLVSALRFAQKSAQSHRRLVCATLSARALTLRIAANNPAQGTPACSNSMPDAPDSSFSVADTNVSTSGAPDALYFQPNGDISSDAAGTTPFSGGITVTGGATSRTIQVTGSTGYVE